MSLVRNCVPTSVSFSEHSFAGTNQRASDEVAEISVFPAALAEGEAAPTLPATLFGDGTSTYSGAFPHTRVIAFVSSFCDADRADEADLERIRAEVRCLGATLLVLSPKGSWCFGPDDRLFKRPARGDGQNEQVATAFQRFGVPEHGTRDGLRAAFVIDGGGTIRLAHVKTGGHASPSPPRPSKEGLLRALVIAADEMERALKAPGRPSPAEAMTTGLITGFKQALASTNAPQAHARLTDAATSRPMPF